MAFYTIAAILLSLSFTNSLHKLKKGSQMKVRLGVILDVFTRFYIGLSFTSV